MRGLGADNEYWNGLERGVLRVQQCTSCGQWHIPAVWRCGECSSWELSWKTVEPKGKVYAWTRTWHQFGAPPELGLPFVIATVELEGTGGRRLFGSMVDPGVEICIGLPVVGEIIQTTFEGETIPALRWKRIGDATALAATEGRLS